MDTIELSLPAARALQLAAQGLLNPPRRKAVKQDVLGAIRQMGVLQIDTIHVVARSPYLVLWSRLGSYPQNWLEELLEERQLFEYWAHEASFLPIEDYGLFRHRMIDPGSMGWKYSAKWMEEHRATIEKLLQHIRENGPVRSADFKRTDGKGGGWWEWKPEKRSLEVLFTAGRLMIAKRHNFHRIYDLAERILPDWDDARMPSSADTLRTLQLKAVQALGVARASWIGDYFRTAKSRPDPDPETLVADGSLLKAGVEGWQQPVYIHPAHRQLALDAAAGLLKPTVTSLLSPFDPLVWDRKRTLELFGFDYRLECYTPEAKRSYGYFTLPILHRGALVGRLDAKAHRSQGIFEVKALYLEANTRQTQRLASELAATLQRFAAWHGTPQVAIGKCTPRTFRSILKAALD
ncbi:winged helix-turn-helix domain-containing protein [Collimonas humicola]|uniref:winged helix-turn-helix domain-containing protein n=1 Tax=Collimonas humicola TaxID=2825886 RepID=UPI001B8B76B8|nr:crosslink repair DNA glycosylase YcaQ family protein [Collimonas humicola]